MKSLSLYNEAELEAQLKTQQKHNWHIEDISWSTPIDFTKPLVPLDENALFFPGASPDERLAISQLMGLTIAACICEMEESLIRLKKIGWDELLKKYPVNPEFKNLGEQFFIEENKHSQVFRKYLQLFAEQAGIELQELLDILPQIKDTKTEWVLKKNLEVGGHCFWWVVAEVEQEFLYLHRTLSPFKEKLDPLYYEIHHRHFEEEARHTSFPYLLLELLISRQNNIFHFLHVKGDLIVAQFLQALWTGFSLEKMTQLKKIKSQHPLFKNIEKAYPLLLKQPKSRVLWHFLTRAPYVSHLVNSKYHGRFLRFAEKMGALSIPFPDPDPQKLVNY